MATQLRSGAPTAALVPELACLSIGTRVPVHTAYTMLRPTKVNDAAVPVIGASRQHGTYWPRELQLEAAGKGWAHIAPSKTPSMGRASGSGSKPSKLQQSGQSLANTCLNAMLLSPGHTQVRERRDCKAGLCPAMPARSNAAKPTTLED